MTSLQVVELSCHTQDDEYPTTDLELPLRVFKPENQFNVDTSVKTSWIIMLAKLKKQASFEEKTIKKNQEEIQVWHNSLLHTNALIAQLESWMQVEGASEPEKKEERGEIQMETSGLGENREPELV